MVKAEELVASLALFQEKGVLCDVELQVGNQSISAHRVVLAAASPYFQAMFAGNFKEKKSQVVKMEEVAFVGLKAVVESIYKSKIIHTVKNLPHILTVAHLMQMTDIVEECKDWMLGNMQKTNCLTFLKYAEMYNFETVEDAANEFVLCNFLDISKTPTFLEISQVSLCRYLSSDLLRTDFKEHEVFKAARKWLTHNKIEDGKTVFEVMKNIRFALIAPTVLSQEIMFDDIIQVRDCQKLVREAVTYHMDIYQQPLNEGYLNKPRGKTGLLMIPNGQISAGFNIKGNGEDVHFLSFPEKTTETKIDSSHKMPSVYDSFSFVQKNNFLFLYGVTSQNYYMNYSKRYDSSMNCWIDLKALPKPPAVGVAIADCGEKIYLIGGMLVSKESPFWIGGRPMSEEMYVYTIPSNTWSASDPVPMKCTYSKATTIEGKLYISGGYDGKEVVSSLFSYDTKAKLWLTKKKMMQPRYLHVQQAVNRILYVIGGKTNSDVPVKSVEMYDPQADQWTVVLNIATFCT